MPSLYKYWNKAAKILIMMVELQLLVKEQLRLALEAKWLFKIDKKCLLQVNTIDTMSLKTILKKREAIVFHIKIKGVSLIKKKVYAIPVQASITSNMIK